MTFEVEITQQGRGGIYYYTEHGVKLPFEWDFSSIGITIYVPTHGAWNEFCRKNDAPWGIGRRQEILQRLGDEVRRRKAKSALTNYSLQSLQFDVPRLDGESLGQRDLRCGDVA